MLFTHRSEILYLERCRVYQENGRVVYAQGDGAAPQRYNFPYRNAQVLCLGTGTSITNSAVRLLAEQGVVLVFSGSEGMPYIMTGAMDYHPNEYAQGWVAQWINEADRLALAKKLIAFRFQFTRQHQAHHPIPAESLHVYEQKIAAAKSTEELLGLEGSQVKNLVYRSCAQHFLHSDNFKREHAPSGISGEHAKVNERLNQGNNLAYGVAAGALWHLGIPAYFPLIHGQSRQGGLIFDAADLIKDALVVPWAFQYRDQDLTSSMRELRYRIKHYKADRFIIETLKNLSIRSPS